MADIWLVTGIPGAGKTTVARLLAKRFDQAVHLEAEKLQEWIVSGGLWPGDDPQEESSRQLDLVRRNVCILARSYAEAGFNVATDHVIVTRRTVDECRMRLVGIPLFLAVLDAGQGAASSRDATRAKSRRHMKRTGLSIAERWAHLEDVMRSELKGVGLWIDSENQTPTETVDAILDGADKARIG